MRLDEDHLTVGDRASLQIKLITKLRNNDNILKQVWRQGIKSKIIAQQCKLKQYERGNDDLNICNKIISTL